MIKKLRKKVRSRSQLSRFLIRIKLRNLKAVISRLYLDSQLGKSRSYHDHRLLSKKQESRIRCSFLITSQVVKRHAVATLKVNRRMKLKLVTQKCINRSPSPKSAASKLYCSNHVSAETTLLRPQHSHLNLASIKTQHHKQRTNSIWSWDERLIS